MMVHFMLHVFYVNFKKWGEKKKEVPRQLAHPLLIHLPVLWIAFSTLSFWSLLHQYSFSFLYLHLFLVQ